MERRNKKNHSLNRRKLLKTVGATTIGAAGINGNIGLSKASETKAERRLVQLEGSERAETLKKVKKNREVKEITQVYKSEGWVPRFNRAQVRLVKPEDTESFRLAVVPFKQTNSQIAQGSADSQTVLLWKEHAGESEPTPTVTGHHLLEDKNMTKSTRNVKEVTYMWTNGELVEQSHQSEIRGKDQVSTEDNLPGGGSKDCIYFDTYCVDFNLSCVTLIVGALGLACTGALVPCLATALMEGGAYYTGDGCNVCDEYTTEAKKKPVCNCPECY